MICTLKKYFSLFFILLSFLFAHEALSLSIPAKPSGYINDYANLLSPPAKEKLKNILYDFEKETTNQIVIATFDSLDGQSLEDFSIHLAEKWKVGTKKNDNGIILLIFKKEHEVRIEVGYGLEGVLPDIKAEQIIRHEIVPAFKKGDFDSGISNGVNGIIKATKGEYSNASNRESKENNYNLLPIIAFLYFIFPILAFLVIIFLAVQLLGFPLGIIVGLVLIIILALIRQFFFLSMFGQTLGSRRTGWFDNSGFLGGGFIGGGSSFDGGFSGGLGGGFGGGGASGRW